MKYLAKIRTWGINGHGTTVCQEVSRDEAFKIIQPHPQVTVDCYDENGHYGSFGCVYATQIDLGRQIEFKGNVSLIPSSHKRI